MVQNELEPLYYSLDILSDKTNIPEKELLLHAEQGNLKLSVSMNEQPIVSSHTDLSDFEDDIDTNNLPNNFKFNPQYSGYLQLTNFTCRHIRRIFKKKNNFREEDFIFDDGHLTYARHVGERGKLINIKSIVILKEHYKDFLRLIDDPTTKEQEAYYQNKPFGKTTALYNSVFGIYVERKANGFSTMPQDIFKLWRDFVKEQQKNDKTYFIISIDDKIIKWRAPTDGKEKKTGVGRFKTQISDWNSHYKKLNL